MSAEEVEYEVEAWLDGEALALHFHPRCHDAWRSSRDQPAPDGAPAPEK